MSIEDFKNKIICGDVLESLKKIPDNSIHLIFTSSPYNVNIPYPNHSDGMPYVIFIQWLKDIMIECKRVLVNGGRLVLNIDAVTNRQEDSDKEYVRPIYADLVNIGREIDLHFRTEICWYKQNAVGKKTAWGSYVSCSNPVIRRTNEYILVWSKGQWTLEGDKELSDMTAKEFNEYTFSTWFVAPETRKLANHPVPFPQELAKRVIKLFSYRGNIVLDIFSGTGTTPYVARMLGRDYIGIDIDSQYCEFARNRIKDFENSDLFTQQDYIPRSKRLKKKIAVEDEALL
jgi:DNA modification methylase